MIISRLKHILPQGFALASQSQARAKSEQRPISEPPQSKLTGKPVIHFAHANGIPSAVYQPMFDALADRFTIEYIPTLGDNPDYPVDDNWDALTEQVIFSVRQACQKHQVEQVIGLGHSLGALCTLQAMYRRPDLFNQALLMDPPWIYGAASFIWHMAKQGDRLPKMNNRLMDKLSPAKMSKNRRDVWDSREQAYDQLRSKGMFKSFDERCFEGYINFGLTERADGKVTLTIPKSSEVAIFRTNPSLYWLTPNEPPKVPVRLIIADDGIFMQRQFPQKIQRRLGIPFETFQGGHMFPLEQPDAVAKRLKQLLLNAPV